MSISHNSINLPLDTKRHSFSHLMAAAVGQIFPEAQYGVGPVIENGCYYDFVLPRPLVPEDLPLIEKKIQHLLKQDLRFKCQEISLEEAINHFANANQTLKVELLENLRDRGTTSMSEEEKADFGSNPQTSSDPLSMGITPTITIYRIVNEQTGEVVFEDLCKGPHVEGVRPVKALTQSSTQKTTIDTYNQAADIYIQKTVDEVSGLAQVWLDKTLNLLNKDSTILEVGSATGRDANYIDSKGFHVTRTDVSQSFIDYQLEQGKTIRQMDLLKPSTKDKFDLVLACAVLLHFNPNEFDQAMNNVSQLLNLGGIFSFSIKTGEGETQTDHKLDAPRYYNFWNRFDLETKVREFGFEIVEVIENGDIGYIDTDKSYSFNGDKKWLHFICKKIIQLESKKYLQTDTSQSLNLQNLGFKLDKFSASYWRGDQARGINMQRLYALVYESKDELKEFINQREEAKKRDHRTLGQQLEIYTITETVGAGLPLYLPRGSVIRKLLETYCYQEAKKSGYQYVYTPHIGKSDLFAKSGHLDHYADGMFAPIDMVNLNGEGKVEGKVEQFYLKPMNCPMHHQIYLNKPKSYRDLPYRLYEYGTVYRYEDSGALSGMIRVRGFTQNDAHVYCRFDQLKSVIGEAIERFSKAYEAVGITDYKIRFSLPDFVNDKEKYGEETQQWIDSVAAMRVSLDELGVEYYEAKGEAAFYGPKIDFQVRNVNGKEDSLSTIQVDYSIAPKFDITYKDSDGTDQTPVIIHMALMGSIDRFMAFVIEMTGGKFPFWLAPEQIRILTINDEVLPYVAKIKAELDETVLMKPLKYNEIRYHVDSRSESLGKKIREAKLDKIPMLMIVGEKDVEAGEVSIEYNGESVKVGLGELKGWIEGVK